jgi:hypothetical protein
MKSFRFSHKNVSLIKECTYNSFFAHSCVIIVSTQIAFKTEALKLKENCTINKKVFLVHEHESSLFRCDRFSVNYYSTQGRFFFSSQFGEYFRRTQHQLLFE